MVEGRFVRPLYPCCSLPPGRTGWRPPSWGCGRLCYCEYIVGGRHPPPAVNPPPPRQDWVENPELGLWVKRQRIARAAGQLSDERLSILQSMGFAFGEVAQLTEEWEHRFDQVRAGGYAWLPGARRCVGAGATAGEVAPLPLPLPLAAAAAAAAPAHVCLHACAPSAQCIPQRLLLLPVCSLAAAG